MGRDEFGLPQCKRKWKDRVEHGFSVSKTEVGAKQCRKLFGQCRIFRWRTCDFRRLGNSKTPFFHRGFPCSMVMLMKWSLNMTDCSFSLAHPDLECYIEGDADRFLTKLFLAPAPWLLQALANQWFLANSLKTSKTLDCFVFLNKPHPNNLLCPISKELL